MAETSDCNTIENRYSATKWKNRANRHVEALQHACDIDPATAGITPCRIAPHFVKRYEAFDDN
jgi:hypothetical protein